MKTLRAIYETRGQNPHELIRAVEVDLPELTGGQVLVEVLASPINPSDVLTITGEYGMLPPLPAVGGNEGVGRVAALGPAAKGPSVGQHVLLPVGCGTWSNHVIVDAAWFDCGVNPESTAGRALPQPVERLSRFTVAPPPAAISIGGFTL